MRPSLVLLNPRAAGGRAAALAPAVQAWLAAHAANTMLVPSDSIERAQAMLLTLPRRSRVVLIGGDGTLHRMLPALLARRHSVGLVPFGTGNDGARALGLMGSSWADALAHALHAPSVTVDTGEMHCDRRRVPFHSSLSAGFDAAVCVRTLAAPTWLTGLPRYLWSTLRELVSLRTWDLRITVDGALRHSGIALFASTCNTPTFGSGMPAVPTATLDDARLDLLLAGEFSRIGALRMLPRLLAGTHLRDARVATWPCATVRVESGTPIPLAADGEPLGWVDAFEVHVRPLSLEVVVGPGPKALAPPDAVARAPQP